MKIAVFESCLYNQLTIMQKNAWLNALRMGNCIAYANKPHANRFIAMPYTTNRCPSQIVLTLLIVSATICCNIYKFNFRLYSAALNFTDPAETPLHMEMMRPRLQESETSFEIYVESNKKQLLRHTYPQTL